MEAKTIWVARCTLEQQREYMQRAVRLTSDGRFCMTIDFIRNRMHATYPNPIEGLFAVMDKLATCEKLQQNAASSSYELYCFANFLVEGGADEIMMLFGLF